MASVSEEAPNSRERQGTEEELLVDTGQDKMDPELTVTECPADTETPQTPSEHAEQKPVEIGIMDKQDTAQEEDADGISNDGLPRADMSFALPGQTAGTDATQTPEVPAEENEATGDTPRGVPVTGTEPVREISAGSGLPTVPHRNATGAMAGSCSIEVEKVLEVKRGERWGERLRAIIGRGFPAPALRDVEEIGSLRDEGSGLRKRQLLEGPGVTPALRVPPAAADEDDNGGITLNKCLLVALLLVGVGFGIFGLLTVLDPDPEGEVSEADPLGKRAVDGSLPSEVEFPAPSQPWIAGIPGRSVDSGISLSGLLDKLTSENQQIRIMHVELQGQKEELEGLLRQEGGRLPADSLESLMRLTRQLSEHLSHEEQTLASLQEELRELRLKMAAAEGAGVGQGRAPAPGAERLSALQAQKETLAAEALMLRQELDKQRGIIASMRQALESLIERVGADLEAPAVLQGLEEMEQRLAFELERSEIWAKVYGTPKEQRKKAKEAKRAQQASVGLDEQSDIVGPTDNLGNQPDVVGPTDKLGDQPDVVGLTNKEGNQPDLLGPTDNLGNQPDGVGLTDNLGDQPDVVGPTDNLDDQPDVLGLTDKEGNQPDLLGPTDNLGDQPDVRGPIGGLGEPAPGITADRPRDVRRERAEGNLDAPQADATRETVGWARRAPAESSSARDAPRGRAAEEAEGGGKAWKKRQAEEGRWGKERGRKAEGPGRLGKGGPKEGGAPRHHEHNKFWKQKPGHLRHRYRAPTGCSDMVACARQEGMELFKVPLEPVRAERFWGLLESYVRASGLGGAWGRELRELAAPFFVDGVFIHQQTRFRDFLDDLEDFVEGIAEKVHGDDDAVEDFEDYIFRGLLGEAATRHKKSKKDSQRSGEKWKRHQEKYRPVNHAGKHRQKNWEKDWGRWRDYEGKAREKDR